MGRAGKWGAGTLASVLLLKVTVMVTLLLVLQVQVVPGARPLEEGTVLEGGGLCLQHHLHQAEDGDDLRRAEPAQ